MMMVMMMMMMMMIMVMMVMCSGPFSGAQDTQIRRAQREGATWFGSVAKWRLETISPYSYITVQPRELEPAKVPFAEPLRKVPLGGLDGWMDGWIADMPYQRKEGRGPCSLEGRSIGGWGWGWGLGASGLDGPSAFSARPEPCSPSIRKRCACGFPQGATEPLRHASKHRAADC